MIKNNQALRQQKKETGCWISAKSKTEGASEQHNVSSQGCPLTSTRLPKLEGQEMVLTQGMLRGSQINFPSPAASLTAAEADLCLARILTHVPLFCYTINIFHQKTRKITLLRALSHCKYNSSMLEVKQILVLSGKSFKAYYKLPWTTA